MTNLRDRFKGAKLSSLQETIQDAKKKSYSSNYKDGRAGFHNVTKKEGVYKLRVAPPHNPETGTSFQPCRTTFLQCELPKLDDDGKEIEGETEIRGKKIFIATIHGNLEKDPVETYIKYVREKIYEEIQDDKERQKKLIPVTGNFKKGKENIRGITPQTNYVCYEWMGGELGRVEVYQSIMNKIEELNIAEQADEPMKVDRFADPDEPILLVIDNDPTRGKKRYILSAESPDFNKFLKQTNDKSKALDLYTQECEKYKVSDKQLEELFEKESLEELYKNVYTTRDFDLAINGLSIFDQEHGYGIFENEEFLEELEEIKSQVPDKTEKQESQEGGDIEKVFAEKPGKVQQKEQEEGKFEGWSKIKMKKFLTAYILENYGEDHELPNLELEEMRKWCILADKEEELPFSDNTEQEEERPAGDIPDNIKDKIAMLKSKSKQ